MDDLISGLVEAISGIFGTRLCQVDNFVKCRKSVFAQWLYAMHCLWGMPDFVKLLDYFARYGA
jgi:hypothetical protein